MPESQRQKQRKLIENLKREGWLRTPRVIKAFESIKREDFVPVRFRQHAYADEPLPIGEGQTISAPSMVAIMTELLEPKSGDVVLEIGAGSGYQAAILSKLVKKLYTVELEPGLAEQAEDSLKKAGCRNVEVIAGDGAKGYPKAEPFDKIIITCAAPEVPEPLKKQLKPGGILIAPVGGSFSQILITLRKKKSNSFEKKKHMRCVFVPLRTQPRQGH